MNNAELIARARANFIGKIGNDLADALEAAEAERDAAWAAFAELHELVKNSPAEWSTSEGVDIIVLGVDEREFALIQARTEA